MTKKEYEFEIDLLWIVKVMFRFLWVMVLAALLGAVVGYIATPQPAAPEHLAGIVMYVDSSDEKTTIAALQKNMETYNTLLESSSYMSEVITAAGIDAPYSDLRPFINTWAHKEIPMISVEIKSVWEEVAVKLHESALAVMPGQLSRIDPSLTVTVIESYVSITPPAEPETAKYTVMGAAVGFVLAACVVGLLALVDDRLHSERDLLDHFNTPLLAAVPKARAKKCPLSKRTKADPVAEAYRQLRATFAGCTQQTEGGCTVGMAGVQANDDSVQTMLGLADALTAAGRRVCMVDGDMRSPALAKALQLSGEAGLESVLSGEAALEQAILPVKQNCAAVPCFVSPAAPAELLLSNGMADVLQKLATQYDYVLVSLPSVTAAADAQSLGNQLTGIVLTVRQEKTLRKALIESLRRLQLSGAHVLGFVLTNA